MFHRILFLLLIVHSVSCNFLKSLFLLFSVAHEHRFQEYSKCRAYQTFLKITHNKTIKWRIQIINSLLCCLNIGQLALQIWPLSKVRIEWLYRWFRKFFNILAESPLLLSIPHRSSLLLLNSPNIMEFSSWKLFIIRQFRNLFCKLGNSSFDRPDYWMSTNNFSCKIVKKRHSVRDGLSHIIPEFFLHIKKDFRKSRVF